MAKNEMYRYPDWGADPVFAPVSDAAQQT